MASSRRKSALSSACSTLMSGYMARASARASPVVSPSLPAASFTAAMRSALLISRTTMRGLGSAGAGERRRSIRSVDNRSSHTDRKRGHGETLLMVIPPQSPSAAGAETVFHKLKIERGQTDAAESVRMAWRGGDLPARGRGVGIDTGRVAQEQTQAVALLRGEDQAARRGQIERGSVYRKL